MTSVGHICNVTNFLRRRQSFYKSDLQLLISSCSNLATLLTKATQKQMDAKPCWESMYSQEEYSWFWPPAFDPASNDPHVDSVIGLLGARPGTRVLDLACGLGWLTIALAQRGYRVTGYDLSAQLLQRAERAANETGVDVEWIHGDMRTLPGEWSNTFDYVTLTLSEFGCFCDTENQQVLHQVNRVLKPEGRFLLDIVVNRDGLVHGAGMSDCLEGDGFFISQQGSFDLLTGIHKRKFRWYRDGSVHETEWQIRAYTPPEVMQMLKSAALQVVSVHGTMMGDPLTKKSIGMTFVAQK